MESLAGLPASNIPATGLVTGPSPLLAVALLRMLIAHCWTRTQMEEVRPGDQEQSCAVRHGNFSSEGWALVER